MKFCRTELRVGAVLTSMTVTIVAAAAPPVVAAAPFQLPGSIAAAWGCTTALVAWTDNTTGLRVSRIDLAAKSVLDPGGTLLSANLGGGVAIAFDGTNYMVAWYDTRPASGSGNTGEGVYAARVRESDGSLVDAPAGFPVMTLTNYNYLNTGTNVTNFSAVSSPTIAFSAGNFLIVAGTNSLIWNVTGARIRASDARALDGTASAPWFAVGGSLDLSRGVAAVGGSTDFLVTNSANDEGTRTDALEGFFVSSSDGSAGSANMGDVNAEGANGSPSVSSAVASDGTTFFVAEASEGNGVNQVGGGFVSPDGNASLPPAVQFSSSYATPSATYDGKNFLAAWLGGADGGASGVYGARVRSADGTLVDSTPFQIAPQDVPVVLAGGSGGVSLALQLQGGHAWFISEDADGGVGLGCSGGVGTRDAGGADAGGQIVAASDGGVVDAGQTPDAFGGAGADAAQVAAAPDASDTDASGLSDSSVDSFAPPVSGSDANGSEPDGAVSEDATIPVESTGAGSTEGGASPSGQTSSGCNLAASELPGEVVFLAPFAVLPLIRRRLRSVPRRPAERA